MTDYKIIQTINGPEDVKKLSMEQLEELASEIREALFNRLTKIGGHFGPNFGMVEAEIAMHYVFSSPKDKFMLGCFSPMHACIDNFIHTYAGMELRLKMHEIMAKQGHEEETGKAKITSGYNLPTKYILHTVGPIIQWKVTKEDEDLLASCYTECLKLAADTGVESIAFCCLSTGVFRFPQQRAAEIATSTVKQYLNKDSRIKKVIFNVFKDEDLKIYSGLL